MTNHALLFTLAAIGVSETVYLIQVRKAAARPVCVIGGNCHKVLESRYSKTLGIHNDVLGLVFYSGVSILTAFLVITPGVQWWWEMLVRILIDIGAVFSLYLSYLQWRVIRQWCFWCLMSAVTVYLMFLIVITTQLTSP